MNKPINSYRDLEAWKLGIGLAKECYLLTRTFPKEELFGFVSQIRNASASVPANIAEGYGREATGAYIQYLRVAQGSLKELETHLILAREVELAKAEQTDRLLDQSDRLGRMLHSLIRALQRSRSEG